MLEAAWRAQEEDRMRAAARRRLGKAAPYVALVGVLSFVMLRGLGRPAEETDLFSVPTAPRQVSFSGDVYEAVIAPRGPLVATARQIGDEQVVTVHDLTGGDPVDVARGPRICCLSWTPDGERLSFQRRGAGRRTASVVPARGGLERELAPGAPWTRGMRWSPEGDRVASWADNIDAVQVIEAATGRTSWYEPEGIEDGIRWMLDVDWGPTGQFAVISMSDEGAYQLHVVESEGELADSVTHPANGKEVEVVSVTARHLVTDENPMTGVRWDADGAALYYLGSGSQGADLMRIELAAGPAGPRRVWSGLQIVTDVDDDYYVSLSDDGVLSFAGGRQYTNLWHFPFDTTQAPRALTSGTMTIRRPDVSPDGRRIAFEGATVDKFDIFTLDIADGTIRQVTRESHHAYSPAWSPSGDSIAYVVANPGAHQVWTVTADGAHPSLLDPGPVSDVLWRVLEWSPGPELLIQNPQLAFNRLRAGEGLRPLTSYDGPGGNFVLDARYSPNGASVALMWNRANDIGLWIVSDDAPPRRILASSVIPIGWSPDGATVFAFENERRTVFAVDVRTGASRFVRRLPRGADLIDLVLAPDGTGVIAAVEEAPGDAMLLDLSGRP